MKCEELFLLSKIYFGKNSLIHVQIYLSVPFTIRQKSDHCHLVSVSFISVPPVKKTQTTTIDYTTPSTTRKRTKQQNAGRYIMR